MSTPTNDHWIDTLSGRRAPDDPPTLQAARAREIFEARLRIETGLAPDPAAEIRWLHRLTLTAAQLREAERSPALVRSADNYDSAWARWMGRLSALRGRASPLAAGGGARVAAFALLLVGIGVALVQVPPPDRTDQVEKTVSGFGAPAIESRLVIDIRPLEAATELRDAMRASGVGSLLVELGDATRLEVEPVPEAALAEVRRLLQARGIEWSGAGRLALEFRSGPRR